MIISSINGSIDNFDIYNKSLGIIGLGQIGTAFAKRAINGFNMNTYYWSRNRKPDIEDEIGINAKVQVYFEETAQEGMKVPRWRLDGPAGSDVWKFPN